jgi:hypothetical protein
MHTLLSRINTTPPTNHTPRYLVVNLWKTEEETSPHAGSPGLTWAWPLTKQSDSSIGKLACCKKKKKRPSRE